jgi:hypothetical protein
MTSAFGATKTSGCGKVIYQVGGISFLMRPPADAR